MNSFIPETRNPRRAFLPLAGVCAALIVAGCSQQARHPDVLATVGDREIRLADFQREVQARLKSGALPSDRQALLEEMIQREQMLQKARALGLDKSPELQRAFENMLVAKVRERTLSPKLEGLTITAEEIAAGYQRELPRHTRPAKARLAMIHVKTDPKMSAEKRAELRTRIDEARTLAVAQTNAESGFGRLAIQFSEDQSSRYKGGDIGWFDEGLPAYRWPRDVIAAGFALSKVGEVSAVLDAENGFYLVTKTDTRASSVTPQDQVQETLRRRLLAEKRQQAEQSFTQEIRRSTAVNVSSEALTKADYPAAAMARIQEPSPPALPR